MQSTQWQKDQPYKIASIEQVVVDSEGQLQMWPLYEFDVLEHLQKRSSLLPVPSP